MTVTQTAQGRQATPGDPRSAPAINTAALFARCRGNVTFALALLGELEAAGQQQVDGIVLQTAAGELDAVASAAHALKGGAAIVGAEALSRVAADIESAARGEESSRLTQLLGDLRCEMDRCLAHIPTIRSGL